MSGSLQKVSIKGEAKGKSSIEHRRFSRIYPSLENEPPFKVSNISFHRFTNTFTNAPELEIEYQHRMVEENNDRSLKICAIFLLLYMLFTANNFFNLFDTDPDVRQAALIYVSIVYPVMFPIPFLLFLSRQKPRLYQIVYSTVMICWSFSFIAGGMFSLLEEWKSYTLIETIDLLRFLKYDNHADVTLDLKTSDELWWQHHDVSGTDQNILLHYLGEILLPAATMNINLLRLMMVFVIIPLFRIDTIHFGFVSSLVSTSYVILTLVFYPSTSSFQFQANKFLILLFPMIFSFVMLVRTRNFERILRLDFLHVWSVERAAELATKQKEAYAEENRRLVAQIEKHTSNESTLDMDSPVAKILTDLKLLQTDAGMTDDNSRRVDAILESLARLDTNLFTPDIDAQMNNNTSFDLDTKAWAKSVFGDSSYSRTHQQRQKSEFYGVKGGTKNLLEIQELLPGLTVSEDSLLTQTQVGMREDGWNFDTLALSKRTQGRPLFHIMCAVYDMHDFSGKLNIGKNQWMNYMHLIDDGYLQNPYHNSAHAADVVNSVHYLIHVQSQGKIQALLTEKEFFASMFAAAIHDFRHPGKTNMFMIKSRDIVALQFSDSSVLERMHLSESFLIMNAPKCNIFENFNETQFTITRKAIIEMVLATDLSAHLPLVGSLKTAILSGTTDEFNSDPMMLMKVVIKCSDIGHSSKATKLHSVWSSLIVEEFFQQGDYERANALSISPFMDRENENSGKNQVGFFEFIVLPFYESVAEAMFDEGFKPILETVQQNYQCWKQAVNLELKDIKEINRQIFKQEPCEGDGRLNPVYE